MADAHKPAIVIALEVYLPMADKGGLDREKLFGKLPPNVVESIGDYAEFLLGGLETLGQLKVVARIVEDRS
jgi:hypothetical protein